MCGAFSAAVFIVDMATMNGGVVDMTAMNGGVVYMAFVPDSIPRMGAIDPYLRQPHDVRGFRLR